eukprot:jgi/Mesvir1/11947/Mv26562-RA.1
MSMHRRIFLLAHLSFASPVTHVSSLSCAVFLRSHAAAADRRVWGFIPMVMDLLDMRRSLHHHYTSYGGWSWVFGPYFDANITADLDSDAFCRMEAILDPLRYVDLLAPIPKLIVSASGDEFFLPDDSRFFWDDLVGRSRWSLPTGGTNDASTSAVGSAKEGGASPTTDQPASQGAAGGSINSNDLLSSNFLLTLPNTEHTMAMGLYKLMPSLQAFIMGVADARRGAVNESRSGGAHPLPRLDWRIDAADGSITLHVLQGEVLAAYLWQARTRPSHPQRRDFRLLVAPQHCRVKIGPIGRRFCPNPVLWWRTQLPVVAVDPANAGKDVTIIDGKYLVPPPLSAQLGASDRQDGPPRHSRAAVLGKPLSSRHGLRARAGFTLAAIKQWRDRVIGMGIVRRLRAWYYGARGAAAYYADIDNSSRSSVVHGGNDIPDGKVYPMDGSDTADPASGRADALIEVRSLGKVVRATLATPTQGYLAGYIEVVLKGPDEAHPYIFTTQVSVVPNGYPFQDCEGASCQGVLV